MWPLRPLVPVDFHVTERTMFFFIAVTLWFVYPASSAFCIYTFMLFCPVGQVKRPESIDQKGYSQLAAWGMTDGASRTGCVPVEAGVHRKITFRYFSSGAVTVPSEPLMCKLAQKGHKNRDRTWMKAAVLHVNLHNVTLMRDSVQKSNRKIHDSLSCRF